MKRSTCLRKEPVLGAQCPAREQFRNPLESSFEYRRDNHRKIFHYANGNTASVIEAAS
jgi:hypothetical protein